MTQATSKENKMKPEDLIVTKTDTKGRIIYCNDTFMEYSGYYEEELLGQSHNIIRHPDMPHSVFQLMWKYLQAGDEFIGVIKNLCKDGSYYWTHASVMLNYDLNNELVGYMSVRRCPSEQAIDFFSLLYQEMVDVESGCESKRQAMDASYQILQNAVSSKRSYDEFVCSYNL